MERERCNKKGIERDGIRKGYIDRSNKKGMERERERRNKKGIERDGTRKGWKERERER